MAEYLFYWRFEVAKFAEGLYRHGGSEQLKKVMAGDIVWVITYNKEALFLTGRMEVGCLTGQSGAEQLLGTRDLWESDYHIIAKPGTEQPFSIIDITEAALLLRFKSSKDRLPEGFSVQYLRSMRQLTTESAALLDSIWKEESVNGVIVSSLPEEVDIDDGSKYPEGSVEEILVNVYERNVSARVDCLEHYGVKCMVCGFNFEEIYGNVGKGYIHVHHLRPLSEIGETYEVDPIKDLRPVCPNCHAMLHRRRPNPYSIEELQDIIEGNRT